VSGARTKEALRWPLASLANADRHQARYLLEQLGLGGEEDPAHLSGGEARRAALARVLAPAPDILLLDEPTNHLDLESREALETALDAFPGTVLLVSHDRALLDAVAERLLAIEEKSVNSYEGGWADYAQRRAEPAEAPSPPARPRKEKPKPQRPRAARPSELERLESEIARQEEAVADLEHRLSEDWSDVQTLAAHRSARDELQGLISRWERLFEEAQA
jgi:ATPase subunit of ABC transporter with duplicated ATPase domains